MGRRIYCVWVVYYGVIKKWTLLKTIICLAASLFPFATFIVDQKILKVEAEEMLSVSKK